MNTEDIQKFISSHKMGAENYLKITFKKRDAVYGIIVNSTDSADLHPKNFWRIVSFANMKEWNDSKNLNFSRIFNGQEFSKLAVV